MTPRPLPDRRSMGLPLQRLKGWVCIWRTAVGTTGPCSVRLADLCRGDEVSRWWWALAGRAGAAGDVAVAGGAAVRRGRGAGGGGDPAAGEHEVGLSVAAALACRRRGGAGLGGPGRGELPAQRRPAAPAARGAGAGTGRARLGRSALDPGPDRHVDRPAVPHPLHPARDRVSAPTAWAGRRRCRGTARGERNEDAVAEWRTLTWATVRGWRRRAGRGSSSGTRPAPPCARPRRAPGPRAGTPR